MTDEKLDIEIEKLTQRVKELKGELQTTTDALSELRRKQAGLEIGQLVKFRGKVYKIASVDTRFASKPWVKGYAKNNDGNWSKRIINLYNEWKFMEESEED
jgi:hypothetical protein